MMAADGRKGWENLPRFHSAVSTMVDANTGLFLVKGSIQDAQDLYTGSTVKVTATTQRVENAMVVPLDVVYYQSGKPYVYVMEDGIAKKVFVETGLFDDTQIQITSGLTPNSYLITTWSFQLRDGSKVNLTAEKTESTASSAGSGEES